MTDWKRDYPEFENKIVTVTQGCTACIGGRILIFDYFLGITIVGKDDPELYLVCAQGPLFPGGDEDYNLKEWDIEFKVALELVKAGKFDFDEVIESTGCSSARNENASSSSCVLNQ